MALNAAPSAAETLSMDSITDDEFRSLLAWAAREREIDGSLLAGNLGFGEFLLQRQLNYDRLVKPQTLH